jgi:hypothetical protein
VRAVGSGADPDANFGVGGAKDVSAVRRVAEPKVEHPVERAMSRPIFTDRAAHIPCTRDALAIIRAIGAAMPELRAVQCHIVRLTLRSGIELRLTHQGRQARLGARLIDAVEDLGSDILLRPNGRDAQDKKREEKDKNEKPTTRARGHRLKDHLHRE